MTDLTKFVAGSLMVVSGAILIIVAIAILLFEGSHLYWNADSLRDLMWTGLWFLSGTLGYVLVHFGLRMVRENNK